MGRRKPVDCRAVNSGTKMAVELGVHCRTRPDARLAERLVGPIMSSLLGSSQLVASWTDESTDSWIVNWGGAATAHVTLLPSGSHEFGDWFANISPGERGVQLSLVLAIVTTTLIAITCDGSIVDDISILGSESPSGEQILMRMLSCRERSAEEVLAAIEVMGKTL
jgi:hypothetical protein